MALSKGDDYPIHQTPEPIAYAGTDRNFYDRYFFNGYSPQPGNTAFFAAAFGVYPHLNIADAAFVVVRDGVETALHASRCLNMERMDISVGPIRIEVIEPLHKLRVRVDAPDRGIAADIVFTGRSAPIEEPRFIRRIGPRTLMDYTRLTQNGRYQGWIELDGVREAVDGFVGTRDRSWGVRPVGAARSAGAGAGGSAAILLAVVADQFRNRQPVLSHQRRRRRPALESPRGLGAGRRAAARVRTCAGAGELEVRHAACRRPRPSRSARVRSGWRRRSRRSTTSSCWASATAIRNGRTA